MTFIPTPIDFQAPTFERMFKAETKSITVFDGGDPSVGIPATQFTLDGGFYFDEPEHLEDFKRDLMKLLGEHGQTQGRTSALADWEIEAMDFDKQMDEAMAGIIDFENEVRQHNGEILNSLGEGARKDFDDLMSDCSPLLREKIEWVDSPKGSPQPEDDCGIFQNVHVDQWRNGGYTGDDFAGDIYAQVGERWLKVPYQC